MELDLVLFIVQLNFLKKKQSRTIKEKNYSAIKEALAKVKLDPAILAELLEVVEDHKNITEEVASAIKKQEELAQRFLDKLNNETPQSPSKIDGKVTAESQNHDESTMKPAVSTENTGEIEQTKKSTARLKPQNIIKHPLTSERLKCPCCFKNMHRAHKKSVVILKFTGFA